MRLVKENRKDLTNKKPPNSYKIGRRKPKNFGLYS